ncbi:MAG: rRNA maturation RNase YbeY [Sedimentisphaerales bacterium]|nr:rRNA maturation RNase YbeY [Sedimentisphaerales bacterium]
MDDDTSGQQIITQIANIGSDTHLSNEKIEQISNLLCDRFGIQKAVISIAVVDDEHIRRINSKFLKRDKITDCISFDLSDDETEKCFEIIVNAQLAQRRAKERQHDAEIELVLYIVHGLLHQMGFDDQQPAQAEKMHKTEEKILQQLGYNFTYN